MVSDDENVLKKVITGDESWVTILKLNNNLNSGSVQTSHGRKKHVKDGAMSSQC